MTTIEKTLDWVNVIQERAGEAPKTATVYKKLPKELWVSGFTTFTEADEYAERYRDEYRVAITNVPGGVWSIVEPIYS